MIIVGEKLNTSIDEVQIAVAKKDTLKIQQLALEQSRAGADFIDVNCGTFVDDEPDLLKWMVKTVQERLDKPLCIDSPNPKAIEAALKVYKDSNKPIINSITGERDRYDSISPLVSEYGTYIIALCMDDNGIPDTVDGRLTIAEKLVNNLDKKGIPPQDIFIDPMIQPLATDQANGSIALDTIARIKKILPQVNTIIGLSNISFGLPSRSSINKAFLVLAIYSGLDAAILDPLDHDIVPLVYASQLISNQDEYCLQYLDAIRNYIP